jgi:hypothetical protein
MPSWVGAEPLQPNPRMKWTQGGAYFHVLMYVQARSGSRAVVSALRHLSCSLDGAHFAFVLRAFPHAYLLGLQDMLD